MDKLLKTIPVLQQQLDYLLEFDASPADLCNSVVTAAFMLLFKVSDSRFPLSSTTDFSIGRRERDGEQSVPMMNASLLGPYQAVHLLQRRDYQHPREVFQPSEEAMSRGTRML